MNYCLPNHIKDAIVSERDYQDRKWGTPSEHPHEVGAWLTIMRCELQEAEQAWMKGCGDAEALCEILQVVAVGVACMQQHGTMTRIQLQVILDEREKREKIKAERKNMAGWIHRTE
jgi:hypothetical protein